MRNRFATYILLPLVFVAAVLAMLSIYIVDERQKALVLRLGRVVAVQENPGLYFKLPFLDQVEKYDDRILGLTANLGEVTPADDRRIVVDAFARWRITDAVQFRRATTPGGIARATTLLTQRVGTATRAVLGEVPSTAVLSDDRTPLMNRIRDRARAEAADLGVEVIDVRLTRTDLPQQNLERTYERMQAEREREAADEIARGGEAAQRIRATADRTAVELTSEARRQAEIVRGEADARRNAIYAEAFGRDPEFFAFTRSMTSYERAFQGDGTQMVMRPDGEFFDYLQADGMGNAPRPAVPAATSDGSAAAPGSTTPLPAADPAPGSTAQP
ncbi:MAG: SPFH domain-containing protein [Paracoccus sp. (in: a-proteobacteria)]|uniref:SPFH domain-containing protein n=1 Tax=Paracoccus sp. TaxID=267 RepID=UPI0026DF060E|nr:SPFH domain-containing protein [Paracoccus sp. (in: a-proteobacteria)]MDO5622322.1 SPFH domain-containing protein [Paracoccus sp. (in: a-proteobacteria)]